MDELERVSSKSYREAVQHRHSQEMEYARDWFEVPKAPSCTNRLPKPGRNVSSAVVP
jgi:hypothetical protein